MATRFKAFKDLTDKDSIYYISPLTQKIEGFKIKTISGIDPAKVLLKPVLKSWVRIEVFLNTPIFQSPNIEDIPTQVFYFHGELNAQLANTPTQVGPGDNRILPVLFTPNRKFLEEWQAKQ